MGKINVPKGVATAPGQTKTADQPIGRKGNVAKPQGKSRTDDQPIGRKGDVAKPADPAQAPRPNDYAIIPGRAPGTIALNDVLAAAAKSPEGAAAVAGAFEKIKEKTGLPVPEGIQQMVLTNAAAIPEHLEVSPAQLRTGFEALNLAYQQGKVEKKDPPVQRLPNPTNLDAWGQGSEGKELPYELAQDDIKELGGGLVYADLATRPASAEEARDIKANTVMAEAFQRLASNSGASSEKYQVQYGGKSYDSLDGFLGALKADGYNVQVAFEARTANFAALATRVNGQLVDVPAPLMIKTGFEKDGREAVVPSSHSEMVINVTPGPKTKGPKLGAEVRWFQGMYSTGFFPAKAYKVPSWLGQTTHDTVTGDKAVEAMRLAGKYGDALREVAEEKHYYVDGYGRTGVCNDSVALIEKLVTGKFHQYPLMMQDSLILPKLQALAASTGDRDYQRLAQGVEALPSDIGRNPTAEELESARRRALESIPWTDPLFYSTVEARKILQGK